MTSLQLSDEEYYSILETFKNSNNKEECVVLSCGPSLKLFKDREIREFCKNKFVISIKMAYLLYRNITDTVMINACNLPYSESGEYYNFDTFSIVSSCFPKNVLIPNQKCDLFLQVTNPFEQNLDKNSFLSVTQDFEENKLSNTLLRKCYPGIMGESCIPFIEYMGFKKFTTIGWDLVNSNVTIENYKHFWDGMNMKMSNKANPGAIPYDNILNIEASGPLNDWLASKDIEWNIAGNSALSQTIKRVSI